MLKYIAIAPFFTVATLASINAMGLFLKAGQVAMSLL